MRVTLVLNSEKFDDRARERMLRALSRRGDAVKVISSERRFHTLRDPGDLVIVAGGDGTVAKAVRHLASRAVPVHIIPTGTSNNIAQSLGIRRKELDLDRVRDSWRARPIDAIEADGELVIESAGCGAIAHLMRHEWHPDRKGPRGERRTLRRQLDALPLFGYRVVVDGETLTGDALLIEVMAIRQIGPRVVLAPDANPGDGWLDLVIAGDDQRAPLQRYLRSLRRPPPLRVIRGRSFTIACDGPWHFDDALKPRRTRTLIIRPHAWTAMVPK